MARKSKSVINIDNDKRKLSKGTIKKRLENERGMLGKTDKIRCPQGLTDSQKKIFKNIVAIDEEREEQYRILSNAVAENIKILSIQLDNYNMLEELKRQYIKKGDIDQVLKTIKLQDTLYSKVEKGLEKLAMTPTGISSFANAMSKGEGGQSELANILGGDYDE